MFAIKVMNPQDLDYKMFSANDYQVESYPIGESMARHIVLDPHAESEIKRVVSMDKGSVAYVMNQDGKTIDTIRN